MVGRGLVSSVSETLRLRGPQAIQDDDLQFGKLREPRIVRHEYSGSRAQGRGDLNGIRCPQAVGCPQASSLFCHNGRDWLDA